MAAWALWPVAAVEITNADDGRALARLVADPGAPLRLRYVHSIYRQPAVEEFAVTDAGLALVRLASPSVAVLEYYARPEPVVSTAGGYEIRPVPEVHPRLAVRVGAVGQRAVSYGSHDVALYQLAGEGARIALRVGWLPRIFGVLSPES